MTAFVMGGGGGAVRTLERTVHVSSFSRFLDSLSPLDHSFTTQACSHLLVVTPTCSHVMMVIVYQTNGYVTILKIVRMVVMNIQPDALMVRGPKLMNLSTFPWSNIFVIIVESASNSLLNF